MSNRNFEIFEKCIKLIEAGAPIEDCIKQYPGLPAEMVSMLEMAKDVMSLRTETVPIEQMNQNRMKLLAQARLFDSQRKQEESGWMINQVTKPFRLMLQGFSSLSQLAGRLVIVLGFTGLLVLLSGGLLITSAKSLPGDSLYPVKRAVEDISVYIVSRGEGHSVEDNYSLQRVEEVKRLIELKRIQKISFEGALVSMSIDGWVVGGIPVFLNPDTTIVGGIGNAQSVEPGMLVEVEGITNPEGWVTASEIHLREYQFTGMVEEKKPRYWQISGTKFQLTNRTQVDSGIQAGDVVTVLVHSEDDGLFALAILREGHADETPSIFESLTDTPTPSDEPTMMIDQDHKIFGTLDQINGNYWVVDSQIIYIVGATDISDDIKIGDTISVEYIIEVNGSFTAIKIESTSGDEPSSGNDMEGTPEGDYEGIDSGTPATNAVSVYQTEESTQTTIPQATAEPTAHATETP